MKSFLSLIFIVLCFSRCSQENKQDEFTFIVKPFYKQSGPSEPPPPPIRYYSQYNIIVDTTDRLYIFHLESSDFEYCGVGSDDDNALFTGLKPKDLTEIPKHTAKDFVNLNVLGDKTKSKFIRIATLQDTVKSSTLKWLINTFSNKGSNSKFAVRRATQEEQVVLTFKKEQKVYHADLIKWDSTRTYFTLK